MKYAFKVAVVVLVLLLQCGILSFVDSALARALISDYIQTPGGEMFQLGVNSFIDAKQYYDIAILASTFLLAIIVLWRKQK